MQNFPATNPTLQGSYNRTMRTIFARTNPAFKRTQLLPVIANLLPPTTGGAARHFTEFTPPVPAKDRPLRVSPQPRPAHIDQ